MARILFVCSGNTCRSPMAEAILKNMNLPGVEVRSAGVFALDGSEVSANARKVLEEKNIPHSHRASSLTKELTEWATHILTMTTAHKQAVIDMYPETGRKTFTLKEFAGAKENLNISDPFGGSVEVYRSTYEEIYENIKKIAAKLQEQGPEEKTVQDKGE